MAGAGAAPCGGAWTWLPGGAASAARPLRRPAYVLGLCRRAGKGLLLWTPESLLGIMCRRCSLRYAPSSSSAHENNDAASAAETFADSSPSMPAIEEDPPETGRSRGLSVVAAQPPADSKTAAGSTPRIEPGAERRAGSTA
eukprot:CAMPEP_0184214368 /NCGR_PEP_ID=MMETSP0976-20121227/14620_1 /TAXON_ID=483370 /ORGANISM="non described non described, Strain CCMP2097" /LENGTH=140 /DNA_ID=CAMNT_0026519123 /DNA_START=29 /DNA_END=449 /DNA_ORIENTATION=-